MNAIMFFLSIHLGCHTYNVGLTINGVLRDCRGVVLHYPDMCFTWGVVQFYCCAACHEAGLVQPTQHRKYDISRHYEYWKQL